MGFAQADPLLAEDLRESAIENTFFNGLKLRLPYIRNCGTINHDKNRLDILDRKVGIAYHAVFV